MAGVFVTGTDTGVGKTFLTAALAAGSLQQGRTVCVRKPLLSGLDEPTGDGPPHDHLLLGLASGCEPNAIAPLRFGPAVSPHLAAALAGVEVDQHKMVADLKRDQSAADRLIVEGAGGWRVPISGAFGFRELAVELGLPVVIAARPGLGTINHCLLTIESVRSAGLHVSGVVFGPWPDQPNQMQADNIATVQRLGEVTTTTLPFINHLNIAEFDHAGANLPLDEIFAKSR